MMVDWADTSGDHLAHYSDCTGSDWVCSEARALILYTLQDDQYSEDLLDNELKRYRDEYIMENGPRTRDGDIDYDWADERMMSIGDAIKMMGVCA